MEHELQPYYHALHFEPNIDLYKLLASRTFSFVSTPLWHEMRVTSYQPIYRNQLNSLRSTLISRSHTHQLQIVQGAYVDLDRYFNNIISMYSYYQAFTPINKQDKSLLWKLS